jgi:hypothetical protein
LNSGPPVPQADSTPKIIVSTVVSFDMFCTDKDTGELVTPDDQSQAIFLRSDRNGDGRVDVIIFDLKRSGRWDLSFWDEKFEGHWTLVGYHDDGSLKPSRFESYAEFQKRMASRCNRNRFSSAGRAKANQR